MFARRYARYYDLFNSDKPYGKEIDFIYKWANKPESIIDIGCGTANYWRYYPKGVNVLGIDKSPSMGDVASGLVLRGDIRTHRFVSSFDCATALFDVINYIKDNDWWKRIPVKSGGYFIFDVWDKYKVMRDGFKKTVKRFGGAVRTITPVSFDGKTVTLLIEVKDGGFKFSETHKMYIYDIEDIKRFCGDEFEIAEVKPTNKWQTWYKCERK